MGTPLDLVTHSEYEDIKKYAYSTAGVEIGPKDIVLFNYAMNKNNLFNLLGGHLRYEFEADVQENTSNVDDALRKRLGYQFMFYLRDEDIWSNDWEGASKYADIVTSKRCGKYPPSNTFFHKVVYFIARNSDTFKQVYASLDMLQRICSFENLKYNVISYDIAPVCDGYGLRTVKSGTKTMKALRQFLEDIKFNYMDVFEKFRDDISQDRTPMIAKKKAKIVLSIHPADFITMSDNDCNWRSCLSWKSGEFSNGTIEAMNSKTTLIAYIADKENPYMRDYPTIPNKSWRSMELVDLDNFVGILTGKSYPYTAMTNQQAIVDKLYELLSENEPIEDLPSAMYDVETLPISVETYGMYNDWDESTSKFLFKPFFEDMDYKTILASGPQTCMRCGFPLPDYERKSNIIGGNQKVCPHCMEHYYCSCCGTVHLYRPMETIRTLLYNGTCSEQNVCRDAIKTEYWYIGSLGLFVDRQTYNMSYKVPIFYGDMSWMDNPDYNDITSSTKLTAQTTKRLEDAGIEFVPVKMLYLKQLLTEPVEANRLLDNPLSKVYNNNYSINGLRFSTREDQLRMFKHDYNNFLEVKEPEDEDFNSFFDE